MKQLPEMIILCSESATHLSFALKLFFVQIHEQSYSKERHRILVITVPVMASKCTIQYGKMEKETNV
jgi:hypothetical protein